MTKLVFEIRLAIAKLIVNRRSTLGKSLFFGLLFAVIFSSLMFIAGSDQQMMKSIQAVMGDADCTAIGSSDRVENIGSIADEIASKYMTLFSDVQTMYVTDIEVDTDRAMGVSLCTGAEDSYFKRLKKIVSWRDEEPAGLSSNGILLESSVADSLFVQVGDMVTVKWSHPETGRANSVQLTVNGIFIGSGLLFKGRSFINISDMQALVLEERAGNVIRIYFNTSDLEVIRNTLREINFKWNEFVSVDSVALDPTGSVFGIYKYYNLLIGFIVMALVVIFFIILNYSNQNLFFMEYRRRRAELASFLTYGMSPNAMRRIAAWETFFQTFIGYMAGAIFTSLFIGIAGHFEVTSAEYSDLITAIGGTRLNFAFDLKMISSSGIFILLIMIWSALSGANRYLKREIREILGLSE